MGSNPRLRFALVLLAAASPAFADDARLSLADAVRTAIASDAELYIAREDTRIAADNVDLAGSPFTPKLFGDLFAQRDDRPPTLRTFGFLETILAGQIGVTGRLSTGLGYTVSAGVARERVESSLVAVYDPATTANVTAELVQPLLRGAFREAKRPIVVASLRKNATEQQLRARIETTIGAVEVAYWDLVRARAERDARASAVTVATEQVEETKRLRKLGTGTDLEIIEAEAGVSRRQQELLETEQDVTAAEGVLVATLGVRQGERGWTGGSIAPTDVPEVDARPPKLDALFELARTRRAEVLAARDQTAAEKEELAVRDDQRRMALDIVAQASAVGFGGRLANSNATTGINGGGLDPPYFTDPAYDGSTSRALRNTLGRDLRLYIGLRFEIPLGNDETEVRHTIQRRTLARARLAERDTLARVESEVRTSVAQVDLGVRRVEAADKTVVLAKRLVDGMRKRFRAGAATTFDVLRVSEDLTRARIEAARTRAAYRVALTRLGIATGTLLDRFGITANSLAAAPGR